MAVTTLRPPVNVHLVGELFPQEGKNQPIRIHPDDAARLEQLLYAVDALLASATLRVERTSDLQQRYEFLPEAGMDDYLGIMDEGLYKVVRIVGFNEELFNRRPAEIAASNRRVKTMDPDERREEREEILEHVYRNWNFDGEFPVPGMKRLACMCGWTTWKPRYWLFHDYASTDDPEAHRFRYRCDISMKCTGCGFVGTWGVIVPDEWWEAKGIEPRKYSWREVESQLVAAESGGN